MTHLLVDKPLDSHWVAHYLGPEAFWTLQQCYLIHHQLSQWVIWVQPGHRQSLGKLPEPPSVHKGKSCGVQWLRFSKGFSPIGQKGINLAGVCVWRGGGVIRQTSVILHCVLRTNSMVCKMRALIIDNLVGTLILLA